MEEDIFELLSLDKKTRLEYAFDNLSNNIDFIYEKYNLTGEDIVKIISHLCVIFMVNENIKLIEDSKYKLTLTKKG